jgi:hypothetical protein
MFNKAAGTLTWFGSANELVRTMLPTQVL